MPSSDLRAQLEASLAHRYTIERELGGGGMSRVFVATERALGRRVVIKVLDAELAVGVSARRFAREVRVAASLQHANIVPLLSAGESDGLHHYAMPYVEGPSLRERLDRDGRPALTDTVSVLRDVARALAYAHDHDVVHRDIKPANVLLSGGAAMVTDFGIAKALAAARDGDTEDSTREGTATTRAGIAVGTPAYMAPEQIAGDPDIDHRADLYAFGCLAYELIAGEPPHHGNSVHALFAAHLGEPARPLGEREPDTPPALTRVVMCCLEKDPALRPQSAREVLAALDGVIAPASGISRIRQRLSRRQRVAALAALGTLTALGGVQVARQSMGPAAPAVALAVIPFVNVGGDTAHDYIVDGVADGLTTALGRVDGVRVVSRSVSNQYRGRRTLDARELRRELGVSHVVHGSWQRSDGAMHVSVQLVSASDNSELWSHGYDRPAGDVIGVESEIRGAVIAALQERYGDAIAPPTTGIALRTTDAEAYDLFLRGRFLLLRRGQGVRRAVENFEQAIARDSTFGHAHASLALALQLLPYFENVTTVSVHDRTVAAAERALELDGSLAEAHAALAMARQHAYDWPAADASYRQAARFGSGEPDVHIQYGRFLFYTGRFAAAMAQFRRASELDPYSAVASGWVGHLLDLSGRPQEAVTWIERAMEIDSTNPPALAFASQTALQLERVDEARAYAERLLRTAPQWRAAAISLGTVGDEETVREAIAELASRRPPSAGVHMRLAVLHLAAGDTASALDEMERATAAREPWPTFYSMSERRFDVLRRSSRFAELLRSVGLDVQTFTSPSGGRPR